jgi:hypothetical protein
MKPPFPGRSVPGLNWSRSAVVSLDLHYIAHHVPAEQAKMHAVPAEVVSLQNGKPWCELAMTNDFQNGPILGR